MSEARKRVEHYLAVAAATHGNLQAEVTERGLRASARFHFEAAPERAFEVEINEVGGVDREEEVSA